MVTTLVVFLPLLAGAVVLAGPDRWAVPLWRAVALAEVGLVGAMWVALPSGTRGGSGPYAYEADLTWIPSVDAGYHVGVDGMSLALMAMTTVVFAACAWWTGAGQDRPRQWVALFCFLLTACLGTFAALDLILFFVFFDLTIVGMYFVIAGWGHGAARASALLFFLYTFVGSLVLLVGFVVLYVHSDPRTFDVVELTRQQPLAGDVLWGGVALAAIGLGLAVKTPLVPLHTWLPPAHTDAPAEGSAVLAGVLLKLGTYGFVRIAIPVLPDAWQRWAWVAVGVGVAGVVWGALVALGQRDVKRMIAYTSVNHMGYVLLGLGAAGLAGSDALAREVAVTGAVLQMVSHGLLTAALFLLTGHLWQARGGHDFGRFGGLASTAPRFAVLLTVAALGSLGLPGLSGFVAEFHVFAGSFAAAPVAVGVAVTGILLTAGLFLVALRRLLTDPDPGGPAPGDLGVRRATVVGALLLASVLLGLAPGPVLDLLEPATREVAQVLTR